MAVALNIFKALLTRLLFAAHALASIYWVTEITGQAKLWNLSWTLLALLVETIVCVIYRRGDEWKWVSASIVCYLATTIPCAWIMEFHMLDERMREERETAERDTHVRNISVPTTPTIHLPLKISTTDFTDLIEQSTMLMLILGRWLLPKGSLTRESLSQLLLVNLAMSADIIEFFDILKHEKSRRSEDLILTILTLWTISLLQFPVNATVKLGSEEIENEKENPSKAVQPQDINKNTTPSYVTRQRRRQSRVSMDYSLRHAPLSDRRLSIIAAPNRRLSVQPPDEADHDGIITDTEQKRPRTHRASMSYGMGERLNIPDVVRQQRRLSVDVTKTRYSNVSANTREGLSNHMQRRYSRDLQGSSRPGTSADATADRITARSYFERQTSLESTDTATTEDEGPKHRVTMDLIGSLMSLFLQDGPFLTFRLYMIAKHSAFQYMIVFLTVKNALLLTLQVYKLCVSHCICYDHKDNDFSPENPVDATSRLNNVQIAVIHEEAGARSTGLTKKTRRGNYNRFSVRWSRTKASVNGNGRLFHSRNIP